MLGEAPPPSLLRSLDASDEERESVLAAQAMLPSDLVDPHDVFGDEWDQQVLLDPTGGVNAEAEFSYSWDWELTPAQRASKLADMAFQREMDTLIDNASGLAAKPPVVPEEFAQSVRIQRAERARRA